ncbi:hypothetical protein C8Q73DRAFT_189013 [Cubamyces lactineus]|nr:hypothetical protein C8Q73DRAFT_189013 [Cubamyces lactineus]
MGVHDRSPGLDKHTSFHITRSHGVYLEECRKDCGQGSRDIANVARPLAVQNEHRLEKSSQFTTILEYAMLAAIQMETWTLFWEEAGPDGMHADDIYQAIISLRPTRSIASLDKKNLTLERLVHILRILATAHFLREVSPKIFVHNRRSSVIDWQEPRGTAPRPRQQVHRYKRHGSHRFPYVHTYRRRA